MEFVRADRPAGWTRPLVRLDALWTKIETYLVLFALLCAIAYMTGWVTLNSFFQKEGKLVYYPGAILTFAGVATGLSWYVRKAAPKKVILPVALMTVGLLLLLFGANKLPIPGHQTSSEYAANVSAWLTEASMIKHAGDPGAVSSRLFTIWVALLGGSLATSAGRQINIDVVMRFLGGKSRLAVAVFGYAVAATSCFVISVGLVDYIAVTPFDMASVDRDAPAKDKADAILKGVGRHFFIARKQLVLDIRAFGHVVILGDKYDRWYPSDEWNKDLNEGGWASVYPPKPVPADEAKAADAPPYQTKPCLTEQEESQFTRYPEWKLASACGAWTPSPAKSCKVVEDCAELGSDFSCVSSSCAATRPPHADAPDPDDKKPFEADLALIFPFGFFMIGCRFLLRGALALGGAVSTDPNAAHGDGPVHQADEPPTVAVHEPIAGKSVDEEALAHVGEGALPPDDLRDAEKADAREMEAKMADASARAAGEGGEPSHHTSADDPPIAESPKEAAANEKQTTPPPPGDEPFAPGAEGVPTAERLEAAQQIADEDEEERTVVGDLSEIARAAEMKEKEKEARAKAKAETARAEKEKKK